MYILKPSRLRSPTAVRDVTPCQGQTCGAQQRQCSVHYSVPTVRGRGPPCTRATRSRTHSKVNFADKYVLFDEQKLVEQNHCVFLTAFDIGTREAVGTVRLKSIHFENR